MNVQELVGATIEVSYSDICKADMIEDQTTCPLVINIIKHVLKRHEIRLDEISVPKNNPGDTDVYFDVLIAESDIGPVKKDIMEKTVGSLKDVEVYVNI